MAQEKQELLIAALVAIVAIVGLVVLLRGGATGAVQAPSQFPIPEYSGMDKHCYFVGVSEACASGVECTNVEGSWCQR